MGLREMDGREGGFIAELWENPQEASGHGGLWGAGRNYGEISFLSWTVRDCYCVGVLLFQPTS